MRAILPLILLIAVAVPYSAGFVQILPRPAHVTAHQRVDTSATVSPTTTGVAFASPSALGMANPLASVPKSIVPLVANNAQLVKRILVFLFSACFLLSKQSKRILWPGSGPDKSFSEPLPPSSLGCPLFGTLNAFGGTKEHGPFAAMARIAAKLGNPKLFRLYAYGLPITSVSGLDNIKTTLSREFEEDGINTMLVTVNWSDIFGGESILYEGDKKAHASLRRLVGSAMSPTAISAAVPAIQAVADRQVGSILERKGEVVKVEDVVTDYTLGIAHRQILGLDLSGAEVEEFHRNTKDWLQSMMNPLLMLPFRVPGLRHTKGFKAHDFLVSKVEEKLARLDRDGPDESTLSKMYFATDDGGEEGSTPASPRKLTRQQVIDNALILIVAGTETSSSTLTVATLLMGLHPNVWQKVKLEQKELQSKYGDGLTKEQLDECTYLDAVVKETMRIRPIDGMEIRKTKETIVVDGKQIPKNSFVYANVRQTHADDAATFKDDGSHMDVRKGFDPGRWLDSARKPSVFMGFGEGGRRCLGERLAYTEMKIFLATLARKVDFDLVRSADDEILWNKNAFMSRPIDGTEIIPRASTAMAKLEA